MRLSLLLASIALCAASAAGAKPADYQPAVDFSGRPADARALDASRHPAEVLDFMGLHVTQAEMISGVFIALGIAGLALLTRRTPSAGKPQPA